MEYEETAMTITAARLDELEKKELAAKNGEQSCQVLKIDEVLSLIRLARLGLWADKKGAVVLNAVYEANVGHQHAGSCTLCRDMALIKDALMALPGGDSPDETT